MNILQSTLARDIASFNPHATAREAAATEQELRDMVCQLRMQVRALRTEVRAGLPDVDPVDVSGSSDPQEAHDVTPDDDIREQIRAELYDANAEWINERATELVLAERQQLEWDAAESVAIDREIF